MPITCTSNAKKIPLTIGLTGGLASGKSTVLAFFRNLHIDTFSADTIVHQLMSPQGAAYTQILKHFGPDILCNKQNIDRTRLRKHVFQNAAEKKWLENCLHPLVRSELLRQVQLANSPYVVIEIPLLAESINAYQWLDRILVIDSDEERQQQRAKLRSNLTQQEINAIIQQQASRQERQKIADDLILNTNDLKQLELEVKRLHNKYLGLTG